MFNKKKVKFTSLDHYIYDLDLNYYLKLIMSTGIISLANNISVFEKVPTFILEKVSRYKNKDSFKYIFDMDKEAVKDISFLLNYFHSNYIYHKFKTKKGRLVYSIDKKYSFILNSHKLLKNLYFKIFKNDYLKYNRKNNNIVLGSSNNIVFLQDILRRTSGGVVESSTSIIKEHDPLGMSTFDIQGFFNSFTLSNIEKNKPISKILKNLKDKEKPEYDFLFLHVCKSFFYKDVLPTGSIFSSSISSLMFHYIDVEIEKTLRKISSSFLSNLFSKFFNKKIDIYFNKSIFSYTRYIDDICISVSRKKLLNEFYFLESRISSLNDLGTNNITNKMLSDFILKNHDLFKFSISNIKIIEDLLNKNGFYIKYSKTKIYSIFSSKKYLGVEYNNNNSYFRKNNDSAFCIFDFNDSLSVSKKYRDKIVKSLIENNNTPTDSIIGSFNYCISHGLCYSFLKSFYLRVPDSKLFRKICSIINSESSSRNFIDTLVKKKKRPKSIRFYLF